MRWMKLLAIVVTLAMLPVPVGADTADGRADPPTAESRRTEPSDVRSPMTVDRLDALIERVGSGVSRQKDRIWSFEVKGIPVQVIADPDHDRMRIVIGIARAGDLDPALLKRMMQANFDTALDARYAIARGLVWATYVHPLSPLTDRQFLSGLGQTVNLARTFGTAFSSGELTFGGGDSQRILRDLIDELLQQGEEI